MALVSADGLCLSFGRKVILDDASFAIQPGDRIGLVGPNGSGKSTLLRILASRGVSCDRPAASGARSPDRASREEGAPDRWLRPSGFAGEPDEGDVLLARGVRVGYLPQDVLALPPGTLVESVRSVVPGRDRLEARLTEVESDLGRATEDDERIELAGRLADLHAQLADFEDRYGAHRAEEILAGLGFAERELTRPVAELSGGWKMRAALAGLLLLGPDLLLLDEPTNHLDLPSLQWFDDALRRFPRAVVLVSHDREFLNRQIRRVLSFEVEGLRSYPGDYEAYRTQREEEERNLELRAKRQAAQRAEALRFIERFRAKATKARQVQSRIKRLAKEEQIQVREARQEVRIRFPEVERSGRDVLRLDGVAKRYGEKVVYRSVSATVVRGDRIAIVGVNGAGKTTLLKIVASELQSDAGTVSLGHNVRAAYYAQHHTETLDAKKTVLEEIWSLVPDRPQAWVRGVLGAFLFTGDDVDKRIGVLSGGERARVALARLLVLPSNLMLMDEPTNHLDLVSSERLVEALQAYGGTLLFVSHNKSFVNQLATKVWEVRDGALEEYPGNLDEYLYHLASIGRPLGGVAPAAEAPSAGGPESAKERRQREARERQALSKRTRPIQSEIQALEARIAVLEGEQRELEPKLADPELYGDFARAQPLLVRFQANKAELEELFGRWEERQAALAEATAAAARDGTDSSA